MRNLILTVLFLALWSTAAGARNEAKIFYVKGKPDIMKEGEAGWKACRVDMRIDNGDRIKTERGEAAEIAFLSDKSNIVRIEQDSDVYVRKSEAPYRIELLNGSAMALINKLPKGSTFEIATPVGLSGARGTGWRTSTDEGSSIFAAFERFIYVNGFDQSGNPIGDLLVEGGYRTLLNRFETPERLEKLSPEELAAWNEWKRDLGRRLKEMLERAGRLESRIDELESRKLDIKESRDLERAEKKSESQERHSDSRSDTKYSIGYEN